MLLVIKIAQTKAQTDLHVAGFNAEDFPF